MRVRARLFAVAPRIAAQRLAARRGARAGAMPYLGVMLPAALTYPRAQIARHCPSRRGRFPPHPLRRVLELPLSLSLSLSLSLCFAREKGRRRGAGPQNKERFLREIGRDIGFRDTRDECGSIEAIAARFSALGARRCLERDT